MRAKLIRRLLRENPEGLTTVQLYMLYGTSLNNIRQILSKMPDVYIDRWLDKGEGAYTAVWCIVVPPEDCPHPLGNKTREVKIGRPKTKRKEAA